jgi:hypothetical protein
MFEEIKLAFEIAKVFKETDWDVNHHESEYGGHSQAFSLYEKGILVNKIWIANGYSFLNGYGKYDNISLLSDFSKLIIWYFGGIDKIFNQYYVSKSEMKKRKINQLHDIVCK